MPSPLPFGRDEGPWGADIFTGTTADQLGRHSPTSLPSLAAATAASPSQWQRLVCTPTLQTACCYF